MSKRRTLLLLDCCMMVAFVPLLSWRFTGLPWHEWLGLALIALIFFHMLVHWGWMESRVASAMRTRQRVGGLLLNVGLFAAMGVTLISGVVISKIALPNRLSAGAYLNWHGAHESATTLTLVLVGLHLAYNWERIVTAIRVSGSRWRLAPAPTMLRRTMSVATSVALLGAALSTYERLAPSGGKILMVYHDGRRELREPPAAIARANPLLERADPRSGAGRLAISLVLMLGAAGVGRRLITRRRRAAVGPTQTGTYVVAES